jgi:hypothetical protein
VKPNEYLQKILEKQTFKDDDPGMKDLRRRRDEIKAKLNARFAEFNPSFRWAGSMVKDTMIRDSYDGDVTAYFPHDEHGAGETLEEVYANTEAALREDFDVDRKASALRVRDRSTKAKRGLAEDTHVDVVPGRFIDDSKTDVNLHRTTGEKERLKTNLQTHIDHIKGSGVVGAIRLLKLWNVRNGIGAKTFVLELLVVKLLKDKKAAALPAQLQHVWTEMRDRPQELCVEDPANSNNDLKPALDAVRSALSAIARQTLANIESSGWESVFGPVVDDSDRESGAARRAAAVAAVATPTRPWCP